jgi:glycosyltransferase involved in cell wall biosynthesis
MNSPVKKSAARSLTVDLRMYRHSGIGRYLQNLFPLLLPLLELDRLRVISRREIIGAPAWLSDPRVDLIEQSAAIYSPQEQLMAFNGACRDTSVLWVPHYNVPLFYSGPLVVTMHDLAPLAIPQILSNSLKRAYAALLIRRAASHATAILSVSSFTASDLRSRLAVPAHKITVTYPGLDAGWPRQAIPHTESDGAPYVLFVGNVKPNKNLSALLRAFALVRDRVPFRLVLAGRMHGFGTGDEAVIRMAESFGDRVRFTDEVSDQQLISLYAGATALCLPSLYEGFGLPLLEAMQLGCPVLSSTAGALPEVAGDAALFFDPVSDDSLANCLLQLTDAALLDRLRRSGRARVQHFSFDSCARLTAEVLNRTLAQTQRI